MKDICHRQTFEAGGELDCQTFKIVLPHGDALQAGRQIHARQAVHPVLTEAQALEALAASHLFKHKNTGRGYDPYKQLGVLIGVVDSLDIARKALQTRVLRLDAFSSVAPS